MRSAEPYTLRRAKLSVGLTGVAMLLDACAAIQGGFDATAKAVSTPITMADRAQAEPVRSDVEAGAPRAGVEPPVVEAAAVPSPKEIFDFHPAGSKADSWRQPFVIDPNDGPLAADVRRSAKELRDFNAEQKTGTAIAASKRCSEMDVAHDKQGCVGVTPKPAATLSRDPLALR